MRSSLNKPPKPQKKSRGTILVIAVVGGLFAVVAVYISENYWPVGAIQSVAYIFSLVGDGIMAGIGIKDYNNPSIAYAIIGLTGAIVFGAAAALWQKLGARRDS